MKHLTRAIAAFLLISGSAATAPADPVVTYDVTINTTSLSDSAGYLDLQFNPGLGIVDPATLNISGVVFDGSFLGKPVYTGDASGLLSTGIALDNGNFLNDYYQRVMFGSTIEFRAVFSGPAIASASGLANSETIFAFTLLDGTGTNALLSADPSGILFTQSIETDGRITTKDLSTGVVRVTAVTATPECGTWGMTGLAIAVWIGALRRRGQN